MKMDKGEGVKMDLFPYLKSLVDMDKCAVVICSLEHEIIYMNPAAARRYANRGGKELLGKSLLECHNADSCEKIHKVIQWFQMSTEHNIMYTYRNEQENKDVYMVALREEKGNLIGYYEKHEYRNVETGQLYKGVEEVSAYE